MYISFSSFGNVKQTKMAYTFDQACEELTKLLPEVLAFEKETWPQPILYSRSFYHGNEDWTYSPDIKQGDGWKNLEKSKFITLKYPIAVHIQNQDKSKILEHLKQHYPNIHHNVGVTIGNVGLDYISKSIDLNWCDQPYQGYFSNKRWEVEKKEIDMEFKQICSFLMLKEKHQPNEPVATELFELFAHNYLCNLVHTRWLYNDYMNYKKHVASQKKRKRDNYKKNLKLRATLDPFFFDKNIIKKEMKDTSDSETDEET